MILKLFGFGNKTKVQRYEVVQETRLVAEASSTQQREGQTPAGNFWKRST